MGILYFKKIQPQAILPHRATPGSAGYDLHACVAEQVVVLPGETVRIPTGLCAALEGAGDAVLLIYARSSLAVNHGLTLPNCVGVVDSDYRGEIIVALTNQGKETYTIQPEERIAQLVVTPVLLPEVREAQSLPETERGAGGFGSTGRK